MSDDISLPRKSRVKVDEIQRAAQEVLSVACGWYTWFVSAGRQIEEGPHYGRDTGKLTPAAIQGSAMAIDLQQRIDPALRALYSHKRLPPSLRGRTLEQALALFPSHPGGPIESRGDKKFVAQVRKAVPTLRLLEVDLENWITQLKSYPQSILEAAALLEEAELRAPAATRPPTRWSEGVFLAKAKELQRRLKSWHIETFLFPVQTASHAESRFWVRRTFRETLGDVNDYPGLRPDGGMTLFPNKGGEKDKDGFVGVAYPNPDDDADRSLTQWLMADFLRHLEDAGAAPAADYLREAFDHILSLPAWNVCDLPAPMRGSDERKNPRPYMVTGSPVPQERIGALVDAAEWLLRGATAQAAGPVKGEAGTADAIPAAAEETPPLQKAASRPRPGEAELASATTTPQCPEAATEETTAPPGDLDDGERPEASIIPPDKFRFGEKEVEGLTKLEWKLLEALCANGRVRAGVARTEVIGHVYEIDAKNRQAIDAKARTFNERRRSVERKLEAAEIRLTVDLTNDFLRLKPF